MVDAKLCGEEVELSLDLPRARKSQSSEWLYVDKVTRRKRITVEEAQELVQQLKAALPLAREARKQNEKASKKEAE